MTSDQAPFRRYCLYFGIAVFLLCMPFLVNILFLYRSDEISPYSAIVADQIDRSGVYGSAYNGNDLKYKVELVKHKNPDIVAIGSS